jgi:hypothetical protein
VTGATILLVSPLAAGSGRAQEARLVADCTTQGSASAATATCELRVTDALQLKGAKATIKGRNEPLEATYAGFDPNSRSLATMFLVQISAPAVRSNVVLMADAVAKIADTRQGKRRFAAYTVANDLSPVADFDAAKANFDKQVHAIRGTTQPAQLYKATLEAIGKLAREPSDRKALIIMGDGNSDDTSYDHQQVVKAAKDAGIVIHALGYIGDAADLPKFQTLQRLAEDTGGFHKEVRVAGVQRYAIGKGFVGDVLENGGTLRITLKEPAESVTLTITADLSNGRSASVDKSLTLAPPQSYATPSRPADAVQPSPFPPREPAAWHRRLLDWAMANKVLAGVIGIALGLGAAGLSLLVISSSAKHGPEAPLPAKEEEPRVVYGWLDMLDGNASRYPLRTTNVRIGRHRDNDICLHNDSISRRHAVLHFNANNRRFIITDLGGDNGVIVNKIRQQSHELNDGDLVELGEVRLRFRINMAMS